jgi:hypothetical protein
MSLWHADGATKAKFLFRSSGGNILSSASRLDVWAADRLRPVLDPEDWNKLADSLLPIKEAATLLQVKKTISGGIRSHDP